MSDTFESDGMEGVLVVVVVGLQISLAVDLDGLGFQL